MKAKITATWEIELDQPEDCENKEEAQDQIRDILMYELELPLDTTDSAEPKSVQVEISNWQKPDDEQEPETGPEEDDAD